MNGVVAVTAAVDLEQRLQAATSGEVALLPLGPLPADLADLLAALGRPGVPRVVVLDCALGLEPALALAARLGAEPVAPAVVLVSDQGAEIGLAALRAGVLDVVHPATDVPGLAAVLGRAAAASRRDAAPTGPAPTPTGRVVSVVSSKGGVGKTTVSTNLAVGLARYAPQSTVLVDLDVQFGDVASALNLEPDYTLTEAVGSAAQGDSLVLKTFLTRHETGLYVLAAPESPAASDLISGDDIERVLRMLAAEFAFVVVDTAPGLSEHTLAALDCTTDPVLLSGMDVPSLRGLRKEIATLDALGMLTGTRRLVLNFADRRSGLSVADVEATLGAKVDVTLPRSAAVPASVNLGVPLLQGPAKDRAAKQLQTLVQGLVGGTPPVGQPAAAPGRRRPRARAAAPRRAAHRWIAPARVSA